MKEFLFFCLLLVITMKGMATETIRIDFVPGCPEEFDVFLQNGFESLGYEVFVNYHDRAVNRPFDKLLTYTWKDNLLAVSLSDKSGSVIMSGEKKFPYLDGIENLVYLFISDLTDRRVNVKQYRGKIKGFFKNEMEKLDSAVYILQVHNSDSALAVKNFLLIAKDLTGNYKAYYDFSFYQDAFVIGTVIMPYNASKIFGIVIGRSLNDTGPEILAEPPGDFNSYINDILSNNPLPPGSQVKDTECRVYLMRSTGFVGSFVPISVFVDDKFVCYLKNEEYSLFSLEPGRHSIAVQNNDKEVKPWTSTFNTVINPGQNAFVKLIAHHEGKIIYQVEKEYSARILLQSLAKSKCVLE
jgi:hypothetical protein